MSPRLGVRASTNWTMKPTMNPTMNPTTSRRESGGANPALLILCVIAGVVAYLWLARAKAPPPPGPSPEVAAKYSKMREDLTTIESAIVLFRSDYGRLPESLDELQNPPENLESLDLDYLASPPVDPFTGEPYLFERSEDAIRLGSYGADTAEGGIDAATDLFVTIPADE